MIRPHSPNHDARGRFATGNTAGSGARGCRLSRRVAKLTQGVPLCGGRYYVNIETNGKGERIVLMVWSVLKSAARFIPRDQWVGHVACMTITDVRHVARSLRAAGFRRKKA